MVTLSKSAGVPGKKGDRTLAHSVVEIEGIGPQYGKKLHEAGIRSTEQLLEACKTPKARKALATKTEISEQLILRWANHADLFRIKGVARQFAELLEAAGVDTVKELKSRRAEALSAKMREVNETRKLSKVAPSIPVVKKWIDQAKTLQSKLSY
ncbi:hypothetical protein F183_A36040 [Bryobacterales bacterium F-183]|nr:hypothetical protein F183_A36040 [Bryobacterales bacterium F-183]